MKQASKWFVFWLVAIAQFMVVLDVSIVNVALRSIQQSLSFTPSSLQWIVTAYTLAFGGFLLLGGRLADLYGRRRILLIGLAGFTFFSLLTGLSVSPVMMIAMRGLQGLSAALMSPSALSSALTLFSESSLRTKALGYWSVISTAGGAVGLLLGGLLSQYIGWRWNFFINVPVGLALFAGLMRYGAVLNGEAKPGKLDVPGAVLVTAGLVSLVFGISQAAEWGWLAAKTLGVLVLGIAFLAAFVWNEKRHAHPLAPLRIFKTRNVMGGNLMMMPLVATMFSMFFLTSLYLQETLHYSPLLTGLAFLPFPVIAGFLSPRVSGLVTRYGFKRFLLIGPWLVVAGLALLTRLPVVGNYWLDLLPSIILLPIGISLTITPILVAATSGVRRDEAGLASGMINTSQQLGGALGLSMLTGIAASTTAGYGNLGPIVALVYGYRAAFAAAIGLMILTVIVAVTVIRERPAKATDAAAAPVIEPAA